MNRILLTTPGWAKRAFSLVELIIVVVIIGVIVTIAIPRVSAYARRARIQATVQSMQQIATAADLYFAEYQGYPEDVPYRVTPPGMTPYFDDFDRPTPIGGWWDWQKDWGPFDVSVSIYDTAPPWDDWTAIDVVADDGDLTLGNIQKFRMHGGDYLMYRIK